MTGRGEKRPSRACRSRSRVTLDDEFVMEVDEQLGEKWSNALEVDLERYAAPRSGVVEKEAAWLTAEALRSEGFEAPIVMRGRPPGLEVPPQCTVADVCRGVGKDATVEVLDVAEQDTAGKWRLEDWATYWKSDRARAYNVITLEISNTRLGARVRAPDAVRELDWTTTVGPERGAWVPVRPVEVAEEAEEDPESTTTTPKKRRLARAKKRKIMDESLRRGRPTVQKYCLMSVAGCYTDFHVDFGGTSVWYHVSRGAKVFYVAPPTPQNLYDFEQWSRSPSQTTELLPERFLPRREISRIELAAGDTLLLPSGWIHAVATPTDSVVFGGNWLHHLAASRQLEISALEDRLGVSGEARMPFFDATLWFVAVRVAHKLARLRRIAHHENDPAAARQYVLGGDAGFRAAKVLSAHLRRELETKRVVVDDHIPSSLRAPRRFLDGLDALLDGVEEDHDQPPDWWWLDPSEASSLAFVPGRDAPVPDLYWGAHDDVCCVCGETGRLICCDFCSNTEHVACARFPESEPIGDDADDAARLWACHQCQHKLRVKRAGAKRPLQATAYWWWLPDEADREAWANDEDAAATDPAAALRRLRTWVAPSDRPKQQLKKKTPPALPIRRRRVRCKACAACLRLECGKCRYCLNMRKFGGAGTMKGACEQRRCLNPIEPSEEEEEEEEDDDDEATDDKHHRPEEFWGLLPKTPPPPPRRRRPPRRPAPHEVEAS
ncbi:hypothetical protein CTAYLR_003879 [Chrysophaeum taylorii]|uniref:Uncharacterized protein n=1 Tax=Chrysophaeum taylorii TaxID=2483200 RepID=A0AAD7UKE4_9STRA|nr:hypothetical protein CTAYLR_003879 [Chrysophaeum taylorii]